MERAAVLRAFRAEAEALGKAVGALPDASWDLPTRCPPWRVRDLLRHVTVAVGRVPAMLAAPAPDRAEVSAAGYYRPDVRFSPQTNADRVAQALARGGEPPAVEFDTAWRAALRACEKAPEDRVVRTRHGDAMLLTDFMVTRVVEVAVHGVDLADALGRAAWATPEAAGVVGELLGPRWGEESRRLGWDAGELLRRGTGRAELTDAERTLPERLTFG